MIWRKDLELLHIGRCIVTFMSIFIIVIFYIQENRLRYPTIFTLAMDVLLIQGSSIPCERVFSSVKETMTDRRSRIQPELMEALQLLKYSIKHGHSINFTVGCSWQEEQEELERLMVMDGDAPENLKEFQDSLTRTEDRM